LSGSSQSLIQENIFWIKALHSGIGFATALLTIQGEAP
jgi:hypothetical protein